MFADSVDESGHFVVVMNDEEQYSIWPSGRAIPAGWQPAGKEGGKQECLDYIDDVWTDMRPLSLRQAMGGNGAIAPLGGSHGDR
jgi:MbtH protein